MALLNKAFSCGALGINLSGAPGDKCAATTHYEQHLSLRGAQRGERAGTEPPAWLQPPGSDPTACREGLGLGDSRRGDEQQIPSPSRGLGAAPGPLHMAGSSPAASEGRGRFPSLFSGGMIYVLSLFFLLVAKNNLISLAFEAPGRGVNSILIGLRVSA